MKKKILLPTVLLTTLLANAVHSQKVSIKGKNIPAEDIFEKIKDQTGYTVFGNFQTLDKVQPISVEANNMPLQNFLSLVFKNSGIKYLIDGKTIILSLSNSTAKTAQESQSYFGKILDDNENPLAGVNIMNLMNAQSNAISDKDGNFQIKAQKGDTIVFSYVGYKMIKKGLSSNPALKIIEMSPNNIALQETVIIGYGKTTKRKNTGAVSSILAKDIANQPIDNPLLSMQGRMPGVQITQDNGLPGGGVRISIRGANNTLSSGGTVPLYVIDGVPFTLFNGGTPASDNLNAYGVSNSNGNISPFSLIAPEDILRIDVLKDADATAIYGSRGANGVILITTKKGKSGKTNFNINARTGFGKVAHYIPMMNTSQYLAMRKEAFQNAGVTPNATNAPDLTVWNQTTDTDWQKWFLGHAAKNNNITASVSGGGQNNSFLFSSDYREQGTVYGNNFNAKTFSNRLNAGHKSEDGRFSIDASINYTYMNTFLPQTDLSSLYNLAPNYPLYNNDSSWNWYSTNPLSYYKQTSKDQSTNFISNINLSYKLLSNLDLRLSAGYTKTELKQNAVKPASSQNPTGVVNSTLTQADNNNENFIVEPQAEYKTHISKGNLSFLAGTTFQKNTATGLTLLGTGFSSESMINTIGNASTVRISSSNLSTYKYNAVFSRLNYDWEGKYFFNGTFRRDGSSRFGANHKFGNFGAVGMGWIFTQEKFMQNLHFLSFGKLRASYGLTGNDQIPNYLYTSTYSVGNSYYNYAGNSILYPSNLPNPNLKWETMKKLDIGLELSFFADRISFKSDYYRNRQSNILTYISIPSQVGTNAYMGNLNALVQNKGFEFELTTKNIESNQLSWTTNFNLTTTNNKLLNFADYDKLYNKNSYVIGKPINLQLVYHYLGPDATTGAPTFQDFNKDGQISYNNDRYVAHYGKPFFGGITNTFNYKNFEFGFMFQFVHRYGPKNATLSMNFNPYGYNATNQSTAIENRWSSTNTSGYFPAANTNFSQAYSTLYSSDYNWGDASYIKFKNVNISYSLPKQWIRKAHFSNISVYAQGQNIYTWAKQKYIYDPETSVPGTGSGLSSGANIALPQLRTIVFGINCSF